MSQTVQIILAVIVLVVVGTALSKVVSSVVRTISSLIGLVTVIFVVALLSGVDVTAWFGWVDLSWVPDLNAWLAELQS